jgi:hypothetical protein
MSSRQKGCFSVDFCIGQEDGRHYLLQFAAWIWRAKVSIILLTITKKQDNLGYSGK